MISSEKKDLNPQPMMLTFGSLIFSNQKKIIPI